MNKFHVLMREILSMEGRSGGLNCTGFKSFIEEISLKKYFFSCKFFHFIGLDPDSQD
jgi:hypothetical protein